MARHTKTQYQARYNVVPLGPGIYYDSWGGGPSSVITTDHRTVLRLCQQQNNPLVDKYFAVPAIFPRNLTFPPVNPSAISDP